ncbi:hypothetical protein [Nocardiopsis metallicus]|uniref:Cell pole-organizing protein PopZ n=1 Tax=Nocardiopsis metallicus TaxID=179819 RepID=A0A840WCE4_9ACTN|nr:hypothetical protein [Nocardiopsis metallicus]MBB5494669.1 cell pole-organizing protein PopZ [Nocardiopsis metallicus]
MTQIKRFSARAVLLATGTAGFVALGAGVAGAGVAGTGAGVAGAGAETMETVTHDIAPIVERALVEGVAPTMHKLAPEGVTPVADNALSELQAAANNEKAAPDLGTVLPPSPLADAVTEAQEATGLDGDPHDTVGQAAGRALEASAQDTSIALEDTAREAGGSVEETASEVLPHTVQSVADMRDEMLALPELDATELPDLRDRRLPELSEAPSLSDVTGLTGENTLSLNELGPVDALSQSAPATVPMSAAAPAESTDLTAPNMWDLAAAFGLETPGGLQDVVEATELTADNYVSLGEEEVLGMVGNRAWDDEKLTAVQTVPQSSPQTVAAQTPGVEAPGFEAPGFGDLTDALLTGVGDAGKAEPIALNGPLADAGLPQVAEGLDTTTVEDLVAGLSEGGLLDQLDTSDLVSIEGGSPEPETPAGMVEHPTFTELPGSEALPLVR